MALFRAIRKGYYGDVMHYPPEDEHGPKYEIFEAPDDFKFRTDDEGKPILDPNTGEPKDFCTWAVPADEGATAEVAPEPVAAETLEAEEILDAEAAAAAPVEAEVSDSDSDDDIEGVETL